MVEDKHTWKQFFLSACFHKTTSTRKTFSLWLTSLDDERKVMSFSIRLSDSTETLQENFPFPLKFQLYRSSSFTPQPDAEAFHSSADKICCLKPALRFLSTDEVWGKKNQQIYASCSGTLQISNTLILIDKVSGWMQILFLLIFSNNTSALTGYLISYPT